MAKQQESNKLRRQIIKHQNIENLEQLQFLNWEGNYGNNNQKIGKWVAYWKGEKLIAGGDYDEFENKIGAWAELDQNFSELFLLLLIQISYCLVFHIGNYKNGIKQGVWQTIQIHSGDGLFDENEKKNGSWTELHNNFNK
ncbi:unnamed protein product (macronuclear) [Paramecium tetraurelia]|uniref:Uncharacterized protein n=1 Tax=Paramecium tetraurelia TaxID=5888 RepID=A0DII1_PARTE|nr:uncharacterized protein GSPATT00039512001 [Paramecium tetraurelia]CAK82848.1 unnamed protein product [Paramecium tetraurelia]|eukprot:XP_001450245.1 hypothetical protein (macronuclear) [Paramecium tetraurelia strain d4-2]